MRMFDDAIRSQEAIGDIDPRVAAKAHEKIRKAARKYEEGHQNAARDQVAGVLRDLVKAAEKGDVPSSGPLADFLGAWRVR
ncbi:hypothetical protein ABZ297_42360 [Nonomuraea sp. NPDC005983]|uniref:hypothetical protein n=1 Tax=Nonomuraea sp. NPDC005983 TaxID=3155595 RepID=UPI0033AF8B52